MNPKIANTLGPILMLALAGLLPGACRDPGDRKHGPGAIPTLPAISVQQTAVQRVIFEVTGAAGIALPKLLASRDRVTHPTLIEASGYSLDYARRFLVPLMGGSIAVGDYNGDNNLDFYVVLPGGENHLFRGNADGTFADVTKRAGVVGTGSDLSAAFADYDHSGRQSLFVTGLGGVRLYRNNGDGTFLERTREAGLDGKPGELFTQAVLVDVDGDGFVDLMLAAYTDLSAPPSKSTFAFPNEFPGTSSRLYRNRGDGTFVDSTTSAGLAGNPGRARSAIFADFNRDGRPDLLLLREEKPPALYKNLGGGKFEDRTWNAGEPIVA